MLAPRFCQGCKVARPPCPGLQQCPGFLGCNICSSCAQGCNSAPPPQPWVATMRGLPGLQD
eukprot:640017-Lingulodinium_polyedra.AAC.1